MPPGLHFARGDRMQRGGGATVSFWLRARVRVPPGSRDPIVLVPRSYVALAAYIDGERVYALDDYGAASGLPFHVVPLPSSAIGDEVTLTLRVMSRYTLVGLPEPPRVGERAALLESIVVSDVPRLAIGVVLVALGLGALGLALGRREPRAWLAIALFSVSIGAWSLFQTRARQLWLPQLELWFALWWLAIPAVSAGVCSFVETVFGAGPRRFVRWLAIAFALHFGVSLASLALAEDPFAIVAPGIYLVGRTLVIAGSVAIVVFVGRLARGGNPDARLFVLGFALAVAGVLHDIGVSAGIVRDGLLFADLGYLVFELSLVAIVVRRIRAMEQQVSDYAASLGRFVRDRDALVRDLHDGLGGVVTHVGVLAQRGAAGGDAAILPRIAELADEGMTELRTLMSGFEGLPDTYRALGAELRRKGSSVLEPHDIAHDFELALDDEASLPAPDLARYVTISRVHREALANVVKHARATRVRVQLAVSPEALELVVEDDGVGLTPSPGPREDGTGRGLPSMRARARSVAGSVEVLARDEGGVRVRLRAPHAPRTRPAPGTTPSAR